MHSKTKACYMPATVHAARVLAGICLLIAAGASAREFWVAALLSLDPQFEYSAPVLRLIDLNDDASIEAPCNLLHQDGEYWVCGAVDVPHSGAYNVSACVTSDDGAIQVFQIYDRRDFEFSKIDVVLVIDASASMKRTDPNDFRITAVRHFFDLARNSDRIANIALIGFQTESDILLPLTPAAEVEDLERYLRRLKPSASTNFDKPFNHALQLLESSGSDRKAVLFLSDGSVKKYRETHEKFREFNAPVHSIGLSEEADKGLLGRISTETSGKFFDAPTADQLNSIFVQVFHLLDEPVTLVKRIHNVPGDGPFDFVVDPTMDNSIVKLVPVSGQSTATLLGTTLPMDDGQALTYHSLPDSAAGPQQIVFAGDGKVGCEIIASTDIVLETVQLGQDADVGAEIVAHAFLVGRGRCEGVQTICTLQTPDGTVIELSAPQSDAAGLARITFANPRQPGAYTLDIAVRGTTAGQPFMRGATLRYQRRGDAAVMGSRVERVGPEIGPVEDVLRPDRHQFGAGAAPDGDGGIEPGVNASFGTTFWSSSEELSIGPLYPGQTAATGVEILISSAAADPIGIALAATGFPGVTLQLEGDAERNHRSSITVTAVADRISAGRQVDTEVVLTHGAHEWRLPLRVTVAVPQIVVALSDSAVSEDERAIDVSAVLDIALAPAGNCDLRIATDIDALQIDPPLLAVGTDTIHVNLRMRLTRPLTQTEWAGHVTVIGERLEPVRLPYRVVVERKIAPDLEAGAEAAEQSAVPAQVTWWWVLVVLAAIIVLIILAAIRGNRRAIFLLSSVAVHAAVLLVILPKVDAAEQDENAPPEITTITITSEQYIQEERIKSEVPEFELEETPGEATAEKPEVDIEDEVVDETQDLEAEDVVEETEMTDTPEEAEPVELQDVQVADPESDVVEIEKIHDVEEELVVEEQPAVVDVSEVVPIPEDVTAQEIEVEDEVTPVTEETEVQPVELTVEPEHAVVEELVADAAEIEKKHEITETADAAEQPTFVDIAVVDITPQEIDTKPLEVEDQITEVEDQAEAQDVELYVEPAHAAVEELIVAPVEVAKKQAKQTAPETEAVLSSQSATVVQLADTSTAAREMEVAEATEVVELSTADDAQPISTDIRRTGIETDELVIELTTQAKKQQQVAEYARTAAAARGASPEAHEAAAAELAVTATMFAPTVMTVDVPATPEKPQNTIAPISHSSLITPVELQDEPATAPSRKTQQQAESAPAAPVNNAESATAAVKAQPANVPASSRNLAVDRAAPVITGVRPAEAMADARPALTATARPEASAVADSGIPAGAQAPKRRQQTAATVPTRAPKRTGAAPVRAAVTAVAGSPQVARVLDPGAAAEPEAATSTGAARPVINKSAGPGPLSPAFQARLSHSDRPTTAPKRAYLNTATAGIAEKPKSAARRSFVPTNTTKPAISPRREFSIPSVMTVIDAAYEPPVALPPALISVEMTRDKRGGGVVPLVQYTGDWDCDKTAMVNLAHQLERRTASVAPFSSSIVKMDSPEMLDTPFVFMTGHNDFRLSDAEVTNLRKYLQGGGYVWINDSTHEGKEVYDVAVRREMKRVLPAVDWARIPYESTLFKGPYDLEKGYKGYKYVLPGDKYRQAYLEQLKVGDRTAVIYTRNDYGDGLEIDPLTHPLMGSLTDLSPAEMQEASVRMGINIVSYFFSDGGMPNPAWQKAIARDSEQTTDVDEFADAREIPFPLLRLDRRWSVPDAWDNLLTAKPVYRRDNGIIIDFRDNPQRSCAGAEKAVIVAAVDDLQPAEDGVVLINVKSTLRGGARLSIAMTGKTNHTYVESAPAFIKPGENLNVSFDFRAASFKSAASDWIYKSSLPKPLRFEHWFFVVYPLEASGKIEINNARMVVP